MTINRRELLMLAGSAAAAWLMPRSVGAQSDHAHHPLLEPRRFPTPVQRIAPPPKFVTPLRLPGHEDLMASLRLDAPLELYSRVVPIPLLGGPHTLMWCYEGEHAGRLVRNPLLRVRRGQELAIRLRNELPESTTIHWHGLNVDERNDGSGLHPVLPGASNLYRFAVKDAASMYWYHPHPHYRTGLHIHSGMSGLLLVEDEREDQLRASLDLEFGVTEIPLLIQDKQISEKNQFQYEVGDDDWIGNRVLVNWTPEPYFQAERRAYRFRLLNASNARPFNIAFVLDGVALDFWLLGTDAGLLDRPQRVKQCFLAPAQRLDVLIDFARLPAASRVRLTSLAFDPMENDGAPLVDLHLEHPGATPLGEALDLMAIDLEGKAARPIRPPSRLASLPKVRNAPVTRSFRVHIEGRRWLIDGRNHHDDMDTPRFRVRRGDYEVWEIANDTVSMPHPMHIHAFRFRVLERIGSPAQIREQAAGRAGLTPQDRGWTDTVLVWPGERVRIGIDFSQPFTGDQTYMFHCHNLEHEDQGLMLSFVVGDEA